MSFKLLGKKVSFNKKECDYIIGLRHVIRPLKRAIFSCRLLRLYLRNNKTMKDEELDNLFLILEFENDEDVFYFFEFTMMGR